MSSPALRDQLWGIVRMARPLTLLSTFSSWFLGVAIAYGSGYEFSWTSFAYGLIVMILVSSSIHFVNEYADYETDALTRRTAYSGGSGVLPSGLVPRVWAMNAAIISAVSGLVFQGVITVVGVHTPEALVIALVGTAGAGSIHFHQGLLGGGLVRPGTRSLVPGFFPISASSR
ncbi:MAG: UbiA family prenyltransferase [Candidatus Bathyarchaeota archaeon]